jgi:hypothetical protein
MFDNLREQADSTPFYEDEAQFREAEASRPAASAYRSDSGGRFLGMTPMQRFILAILVFFAVCALGAMLLLITGRISLM